MNQLRNLNILIGALVTTVAATANAQTDAISSKYYPEASLVQIYTQEQIEQKKADELESRAAQQRDNYEKQKREVEKQVAAHRFQIEGLKMQQEKAQGELDLLTVDLQHVNGDLSSYQAEHLQLDESSKATIKYLESQRTEMAAKQKAVDTELANLKEARQKAEKEVYNMAMQIERYKTEIEHAETKVQEAEAQRAALEADEMKVRGEWMQTKMAAAEHARQRNEAIAELGDAKKRYDQAQKELQQAKAELGQAEKQRGETQKRVQSEVSKYESDIMKANKNRIGNETEKIRIESEMVKIKEYASRLKENRDQSIEQNANSEGLVLKSSLALESARTALTSSVERADQNNYKAEKLQHQARGLANAEEASNLVDGGRVWVTNKNCKAFTKPNAKTPAGFFDSGKRLLAKDHGTRWVEIMNGTGASVYMESRCGNYDN